MSGDGARDGGAPERDTDDWTLAAVTDALLAVEADLDLLSRTADGCRYWAHVRFDAQQRLLERTGATDRAHGSGGLTTADRARRILGGLRPSRNPWLAPDADLLVWGHERRTRRDEVWHDRYCDPLLDAFDGGGTESGGERSWTFVEAPHEGEHLTPARTDGVRYLDPVLYGAGLADHLGDPADELPASERTKLRTAEARLRAAVGTAPDLVAMVGRRLARRRLERPAFRALLRRVDPDLAVVTVWYTKPTFVEVCREEGVPVAELQHGVMSPYHLGYAYPDSDAPGWTGSPSVFPDYLLSWGEHWADLCPLPLPAERVLPVGYPELERGRERYAETRTRDRVTFISQGTAGVRLSRVACEVADRLADRADGPGDGPELVYKLHPSEYDRWRDRTPWLVDAHEAGRLRVVADPSADLYELFATSRAQVGVYSTALFEGLAFGCETLLVDLPGVAYMDRLVEAGAATVLPDAAAVAEAIAAGGDDDAADTEASAPAFGPDAPAPAFDPDAPAPAFDPDAYFRPDATRHAVRTLDRLAAEGRRR
ncbi:hypothetical protein [Haloglomus halophilum]|uniref:hypothetical protein n=1 Tax=Haloglomus halophilum TaxID=2962672 RepID=UPI0020C9A2A1|nr:hypothetical protein [Haloglomus halophilum]